MESERRHGPLLLAARAFPLKLRRLPRIIAPDAPAIRRAGYCGLIAASLAAFFFGLGGYGILNGNESLYVESAREMLLSGDLAVPTLNGLPYLEKPPLFVWLLAAAMKLFGPSEYVARSVTGLAALALIFATVRFSLLFGIGKTGLAAGFILLTTLGIDLMSRVAMPDLLLTTLFTSACFSFLAAVRARSLGYLRLCAALLGGASLVKGLLPVGLFAFIAIAFCWLQPARRGDLRRLACDKWSAVILVLPLAAWLAAIEVDLPGAAFHFIFNEHIQRFLGTREPHDYYTGSVFYYVPRLFLFFFPWIGVLAFGRLAAGRVQDRGKREVSQFLWLCVWIPFAFFTVSNAKANYYILPCLPAMALLSANYLPSLALERQRLNMSFAITVPVLILVAISAIRWWMISSGRAPAAFRMHDGNAALSLACVVALALIANAMLQADWRRAAVLCLGGLILPLSLEFDHIISRIEPSMSARAMAAIIRERYPGAPVYLYQDFEALGGLPIYLERTIPVIDSKSSDLYFGSHVIPRHPNLVTVEQAAVLAGGSVIAVMRDREAAFSATKLRRRAVPEAIVGKVTLYRLKP